MLLLSILSASVVPRLRVYRRLFFSLLFLFCFSAVSSHSLSMAQAATKPDDEVSGKKSVLFEGKEGDDVKIREGVTVTGTSPAKAVINGDVTMENGAVLKNVTINANLIGVTVEKGASVTLENVTIKGASDTGIYSKEGSGTLAVRNSRIIQNRKGFYLLPGKNVVLTGNQITGNSEEGIDIRRDVDGIISGNAITGNGEGGAEIIVGDSTLMVTRNTFSSNKSSGLALQFYPDNNLGKMTVSWNVLSGNGDYGLVCNSPSGGDKPSNFFRNSIKLSENVFSANKKGLMRGCGLINVVAEKEPEEEVAPEIPFEEEPSRIQEVALEMLMGEVASVEVQIREPWAYRRSLKMFLVATDREYFIIQRENLRRLSEKLERFRSTEENERLTEINALIPDKVARLEATLAKLATILEEQEGWNPWSA